VIDVGQQRRRQCDEQKRRDNETSCHPRPLSAPIV
jgi:hypothetical protein